MANNELLKFPLDINNDDVTPFVKLVALDWRVINKRDVNVENNRDISDTIILPIPSNGLNDTLNISWQEDAGLEAEGISSVLKQAGLTALKNLLGGVASKVSFNRGQTLNDLAASTFENVEFRTHTFEWNLIPRSANEATALQDIIQRFKLKALPARISDNVLEFPSFWMIEVRSGDFQPLISYNIAVCTEISTDFLPDTIEAFHTDGKPVKTNLTVSFKELFRTSREDFV